MPEFEQLNFWVTRSAANLIGNIFHTVAPTFQKTIYLAAHKNYLPLRKTLQFNCMKKYILTVAAIVSVSTTVLAQTDNKLTKDEKKDGYKLIFNGKNTDGWHLYNNKAAGAGAWSVVDGTLKLDNKAPNQGDLIT